MDRPDGAGFCPRLCQVPRNRGLQGLIGIFSLLQVWLGLLDMGMKPTLAAGEMARFAGGSHTVEFIRDLLRSVEVATLGLAVLTLRGLR